MTDKEIARALADSRKWANLAGIYSNPKSAYECASLSVWIIHHIINSIDWEG